MNIASFFSLRIPDPSNDKDYREQLNLTLKKDVEPVLFFLVKKIKELEARVKALEP